MSKLQRSFGGKVLRKGDTGKALAYGTTNTSCCCCQCEECDADNLYDGYWPQFYTATLSSLFLCSSACHNLLGSVFAKASSLTGTEGSVNTTYRMCKRRTYTSGSDPRALYHCKVPAAKRLTYQQYTNSGCTATTTNNLSLLACLELQYFLSSVQTFTVTTVSRAANVVTVTTSAAHGLSTGNCVVHEGITAAGATDFNGTFLIASTPSATTYTVAQTAANDTGSGGTSKGPQIVSWLMQIALIPEGVAFLDSTTSPTTYATGSGQKDFWLSPTEAGGTFQQQTTPTFRTITKSNQLTTCASVRVGSSGTVSVTPCTLI